MISENYYRPLTKILILWRLSAHYTGPKFPSTISSTYTLDQTIEFTV